MLSKLGKFLTCRLCSEGGNLLQYGVARPPEEAAQMQAMDAARAAEKLRADGADLVVETPLALKREEREAREAWNAAQGSRPVDPSHRRTGKGAP